MMVMMQYILALLLLLVAVLAFMVYKLRADMRHVRKSERMKKVFLENIHHEIRVPLKVFHSLSETVGKDDLYLSKNEKRNIADQLLYNANLIGTLLDEVMMFSDSSESGHLLQIESFSPNALCRRCLEANMNSIYHCKRVKLQFNRELRDEFFVNSDRHLVELIINKLIINACKFTEEGTVTVGCNTTTHTDRLTIYVSDTGKGIPEARMSNLFSYFDEPDDLQDEAELDLSICRRIAEKLGGELLYDVAYQDGTRLELILPLR